MPCVIVVVVRYRNRVTFYSTEIAASMRRCVNTALRSISIQAVAAVACNDPAVTQRDQRWITAPHRQTTLSLNGPLVSQRGFFFYTRNSNALTNALHYFLTRTHAV